MFREVLETFSIQNMHFSHCSLNITTLLYSSTAFACTKDSDCNDQTCKSDGTCDCTGNGSTAKDCSEAYSASGAYSGGMKLIEIDYF